MRLNKKLMLMMGGSDALWWTSVPVPNAALNFVPFTIQKQGDTTFRVDPTFDLRTHAGITVAKTYYVATNGNDANDGLSAGAPLANISTALGKADRDRVYIAAGVYKAWESSIGISPPARSVEIIGVGKVELIFDYKDHFSAFSASGNHYDATSGANVMTVMDRSSVGSDENYILYTLAADEAAVDSTPGSWVKIGTTIHIRTFDSRPVDDSISIMLNGSGGCLFTGDNFTVYLENLNFYDGSAPITASNSSVAGGMKLYIKDCTFDGVYSTVYGIGLNGATGIFQNVTIRRIADDGIRLMPLNTVNSTDIEWDCTIYDCGHADHTASNASSCHGNCSSVRINCDYSHTRGAPIMDIGGGKGWCLGVYAHHNERFGDGVDGTASNISCGDSYYEMWLDGCRSSDSKYDYIGSGTNLMHLHNCTGDATSGGTDTYTY